MSATILPFTPRAVAKPPRARAKAVAGAAERLAVMWPGRNLPLVLAAIDMLQADDDDFAERCSAVASQPGALAKMIDQLSRLAGHMADVAEALTMTAQRIRSVTLAHSGVRI